MFKRVLALSALALLFCVHQLYFPRFKSWAHEVSAYDTMLEALYLPFKGVKHMQPETWALKNQGDYLILDIRSADEYAISHLQGAKFIDYQTFDLTALKGVDKNQPILVYCSVGYRSSEIAAQLQKAGYGQVENLYGGIFLWVNQGKAVYRGDDPVPEIHPYDKLWGKWLKRGVLTYHLEATPSKAATPSAHGPSK